ncbi:NAD(P)-dependent oxidoreductase [Effusibacillus consociatus]|uniref:NAD(P)-dependent oxidoreductase n=1 Tax=Effusibacillus consociatus TaxID=1117041 RepID=A0ABV9Q6G5_9BACL
MAVLIVEDLWCELPDWFSSRYQVIQEPSLCNELEKIRSAAPGIRALVVRNRTRVDRDLLNCLPNVKVIGRLGIGLDNIDLKACREREVVVVAAKGCNANSVAEYVIAGIFQHARFLSACDTLTRSGLWDRKNCMGHELHGKTLGVIGVGDIGQRLAIRARAFGMNVVAYDPYIANSHMLVQDFGVDLTSLEDVCRMSDYISVHVPLTTATHHLIGHPELSVMKETAVIINTSRGGIIDERALLSCLEQSPQRFAILDVREVEPPAPEDPFRLLPNVILTPHIAGVTHESSQRVAEFIFRDIDRVLSGQPPLGAV